MVIGNKWVLSALPDLPLTFLWLQLLVAVVLLAITHLFGVIQLPSPAFSRNSDSLPYSPVYSNKKNIPGVLTSFLRNLQRTLPTVNWKKSEQLMPLIAVNVIGLTGNTLCLKYIDASLYQV